MQEGGLEKPTRHAYAWNDSAFYNSDDLDAELRRVFDICHGCRRCFNLCDSFPRLFDLIDSTPSEELGEVKSTDFESVVEACTLCDMCYMTKCPYVPPHPFALDFPHLMVRARAVALRAGKVPLIDKLLSATDRNGKLAGLVAVFANTAISTYDKVGRWALELIAKVHRKAVLPKYHFRSFKWWAVNEIPHVAADAPAKGRKAVLYATCFVNYNDPGIGKAAQAVLAKNGVETEVVYPVCCGMPQLEQGDLAEVANRARRVSTELKPWIDKGYAIIALIPSCALMFRSEWPLILPDDPNVQALAKATRDISEYVVDIAGKEGLAEGLKPLEGGVWLHAACHARAQNIGPKAAEMLRMIPGFEVGVIERCSGHGGSWGVKKDNFEIALKVGKPVARQVAEEPRAFVSSECPLAAAHVVQGAQILDGESVPKRAHHPIELFAQAYRVAGPHE
jgi:glycerol-3-phosphate dehydrogenase subunit C